MSQVEVKVTPEAIEDIRQLAAGVDRTRVALDALSDAIEAGNITPSQRRELTALAAQYGEQRTPALTGVELSATRVEYPDSRRGFAAHKAIDFTAVISREISVRDALVELLGSKNAGTVMSDWGSRVGFDTIAPRSSQATLFLNSNNKARNKDYAPPGAETTQEADFESTGLTFASDVDATIVCAALVKKAEMAGIKLSDGPDDWDRTAISRLRPEELDLLTKLRVGVVRTSSGALYVLADGRLRASDFGGDDDPHGWAFGARPSAEPASP